MSEFRPVISIILTIVLVLALFGVINVLKKGDYEAGDYIYFVDGKNGKISGSITPGEYGPLLDLIAKAESGGYDSVNPSTKVDGLSTMTIAEARNAALAKGSSLGGSGAMGRYQFMPDSVIGWSRDVKLNPEDDLFSPENQDKIAVFLINGRGSYEKWRTGETSDEEFALKLSMIWAGLPKDFSGVSYYQGVGSNRATVSWDEVMKVLEKMKSENS